MTTLKIMNQYFQLKQTENMILAAEQNFKCKSLLIGGTRETQLTEFRIVANVTGRQTGSTERAVKLFNPATDIYVDPNGVMIDNFIGRVRQISGDDKLRVWFANLNSKNLKETIPKIRLTEVKRVWLDVGGDGLYKRSTVMNHIIRSIEKHFNESNPIYIII